MPQARNKERLLGATPRGVFLEAALYVDIRNSSGQFSSTTARNLFCGVIDRAAPHKFTTPHPFESQLNTATSKARSDLETINSAA
jgi:hypothetical protein